MKVAYVTQRIVNYDYEKKLLSENMRYYTFKSETYVDLYYRLFLANIVEPVNLDLMSELDLQKFKNLLKKKDDIVVLRIELEDEPLPKTVDEDHPLLNFLQKKEVKPWLNPHITYKNETIYVKDKIIDINDYIYLFKIVCKYFKQIYDALGTEAQVIVCYNEGELPDYPVLYKDDTYVILVPPQHNTPGITSVPQKEWLRMLDITTPLMRIHSHHVLHAYRSSVDDATLNSGILEVILGKVTSDEFEMVWWLDDLQDKSVKQKTYHPVTLIKK